MAISLASLRTTSALTPPRILIHGVAGVGKSTFAADADRPVFIMTEDGLGKLQVPHFPLATSYAEVAEALDALLDEDHDFGTVVIDSVDWLEPLIWAEACKRNGWQSIETPGFGKGYAEAVTVWREYLDKLNALRDRKGKDERDAIIAAFKRGEIRALASMGVLTTGFNAPAVDLIALLRPTQSAGLYVQMVGRGTRLAPGKENCLVLDFAGNVRRHGPIDLVRPKRPGENGGGEAPTKVCPMCESIVALSATECPDCGYEFPAREVKIALTAATLPVLSPKASQWLQVSGVSYSRHDKRGGRPSLKVTYSCGLATYSEWVCFEHQGYARQKAADWWRKRAPGLPVPLSVNEAIAQANRLTRPSEISVRPSGRYFEISGYRFDPCAKPTPASAPSATGNLAALAGSTRSSGSRTSGGMQAASASALAPARTSAMGGRA